MPDTPALPEQKLVAKKLASSAGKVTQNNDGTARRPGQSRRASKQLKSSKNSTNQNSTS